MLDIDYGFGFKDDLNLAYAMKYIYIIDIYIYNRDMPEVLSVQNLAFQLMLTIRSKKRCPSRQMLPLIIRDMPATLCGKNRALQSMWMS